MVAASDPQQRFVLVRLLADGAVVKAEQGELVAVDHADDDAMWTRAGDRLVHALTGRELRVEPQQGSLEPAACGDGECVGLLDAGGRRVTVSGETSFVLQRGPERLPSASVAELDAQGWTVLPSLLHPGVVAALKQACDEATAPAYSGPALADTSGPEKTFLMNMLCHSPVVCKVSTHPVILSIAARFLRTENVKYAHSPHTTVLHPQDGSIGPGQGWVRPAQPFSRRLQPRSDPDAARLLRTSTRTTHVRRRHTSSPCVRGQSLANQRDAGMQTTRARPPTTLPSRARSTSACSSTPASTLSQVCQATTLRLESGYEY